jgi:hypothetical protein
MQQNRDNLIPNLLAEKNILSLFQLQNYMKYP